MNIATLHGRTVRARCLGADRDAADGEWAFHDGDAPRPVTQIGVLTVNRVDALDYTQYIVNGIPVDPATIQPVTLHGNLHVA